MRFRMSLLGLLLTVLCLVSFLPNSVADVSAVSEVKSATDHNGIILDQYYLGCLSHASYLIGDPETKTAVIVDPQRDVDRYIEDAAKQGLKITHVILTHIHADFVAGHLELQRRTGAQICMGSKAKVGYTFKALKEGETIDLGKVRLKIIETPGHTPEAISMTVQESGKDKPFAVLTGDCLFIGDVGRPDLLASVGFTSEQLAAMMYDSLHNKLMLLPDETMVYPAHGAGSLCGKNLSKDTFSTMGEQKKTNHALRAISKEEFVKEICANQPPAPKYFSYDAAMNCKDHSSLEQTLELSLKPMSADEAILLKNKGAQLLDSRTADEYAKSHVQDSVNIPLTGTFATWAGHFLRYDAPVVVIATAGKEKETVTRLGRVGFDKVVGYVKDGLDTFSADVLTSCPRTGIDELNTKLHAGKDIPLVVDIRTDGERQQGFIEGSIHVPLMTMLEETDKLPKDRDLVIQCSTGFRSSIAVSLLKQRGITRVSDLAGGITAWKNANLPVTKAGQTCSKEACAPAK